MLFKIGPAVTAIVLIVVSVASGQSKPTITSNGDDPSKNAKNEENPNSIRIKNRFVKQKSAAPLVESEPIKVEKSKLANPDNSPEMDDAVVVETKQQVLAEARSIHSEQHTEVSQKRIQAPETEIIQTPNFELKSSDNKFKSPSSFLVRRKSSDFGGQTSLELNAPKTEQFDVALEDECAAKSFVDLSKLKSEVETKSVRVQFSSPQTIESGTDIVLEVGRAHQRISQSVKYRFDHNNVRTSYYQDQQDRGQQDVDQWAKQLQKPLDGQIMSRAANVGSAEQNQTPEDYTKSMNYLLTATDAPIVRTSDNVVWQNRSKLWEAPNFFHRPLYFENENLERYGQVQRFQSTRSAIHFFGRIPVMPYMAGLRMPNERVYPLGYYRHGSCNPAFASDIPVNRRALLFQSLATTGFFALMP